MPNISYVFKVWQNGNNQKWYWNAKTPRSQEIIASSSQGFASKQSAIRNASLSGFKP
ncbi:hypothetical protein [Maribacter stanieri]|uniref:hypothetical protein n=1 Tax=Maribacter stanieri TaxID=440514 RepID=UPI0030D82D47|tara:strand:- start:255 stop:425 length:171 start_codon:yes stop_codon:yes gene_type:complete